MSKPAESTPSLKVSQPAEDFVFADWNCTICGWNIARRFLPEDAATKAAEINLEVFMHQLNHRMDYLKGRK